MQKVTDGEPGEITDIIEFESETDAGIFAQIRALETAINAESKAASNDPVFSLFLL
jgi:hypothetical protein